MELLSPAGGPDALKAAVRSGADAVYLGVGTLNARASAGNFDENSIAEAVEYCHLRSVRVYAAMNTLVYERELDKALYYAQALKRAGADGIIVQDLGLARELKRAFPGAPLHASTQMAVHNLAGAKALEDMGFCRAVLSREVSLDEIARITSQTRLEIEVFVHGALCVSVSGACLLSSVVGGRSGNRGRCAQPCRLDYSLPCERETGTLLCTRDLCAINLLPDLARAGVCSLKIEGRMKSPEYVAAVTGAYRRALDGPSDLNALISELERAYSRGGFCQGYLAGGANLTYNAAKGDAKIGPPGAKEQVERTKLTKITLNASIMPGEPARLSVSGGGVQISAVSASSAQPARSLPLSEESTAVHLCKLDGAPFEIVDCKISTAGAFMPVSALNELRRSALGSFGRELARIRMPAWSLAKDVKIAPEDTTRALSSAPLLFIQTDDFECAQRALQYASGVYLDVDFNTRKDKIVELKQRVGKDKLIYLRLPLYLTDGELSRLINFACGLSGVIDGVSAQNLGAAHKGVKRGLAVISDYMLYAFNPSATLALKELGVLRAALSPELNAERTANLAARSALPVEGVVHGRLALMQLRHCPRKAVNKNACLKCGGAFELIDRKGAHFPARRIVTESCTVELLNSVPMVTADVFHRLPRLDAYRLILYGETPDDAEKTAYLYARAVKGDIPGPDAAPLKQNAHTRGHWFRGAL